MKNPVIVINSNKKQNIEFCQLLQNNGYTCVSLKSVSELEKELRQSCAQAVIIDIDTVEITSRAICRFTKNFSQTYFITVSAHAFHPKLGNAISHCIYACINKPVDPDELFYWLRSISRNHNVK